MTKPPYQVPSMTEIEALPWNGFKVASTFSGCGGSCLGYRMAGFRVLWASEFIPAAQETYRANHPSTILDTRDIRQVKPEDILKSTGLRVGDLDLFDGSPPCASFSTAGKREAGWGKVKTYSDTQQRTDDLFFEYARILKGLQPRTFVAENVSGLVKGTAKGYFIEILRTLKGCGYEVEAKVLDAQWLGVPQARQRLIFVGVRKDLGIKPTHPRPLPYRYSIKDVIGVSGDISLAADGLLPDGRRGFVQMWRSTAMPFPTIAATIGSKHYYLRDVGKRPIRRMNIVDCRAACSFPEDFELYGSLRAQWERLGRAVPPVMMMHIAAAVRDGVLHRCSR